MEQFAHVLLYIFVVIALFLVFREIVCWYWKINDMVKNQNTQIDLLKQQNKYLELLCKAEGLKAKDKKTEANFELD